MGQSRRIEIQEGNPLILPCRVLGSPEDLGTFPSVQWTLNGRRVVLDGNVYMKPGQTELMFFGVRRGDSGNYSCRLAGKAIKGMEGRKAEELTYRLHVKGTHLSFLQRRKRERWMSGNPTCLHFSTLFRNQRHTPFSTGESISIIIRLSGQIINTVFEFTIRCSSSPEPPFSILQNFPSD